MPRYTINWGMLIALVERWHSEHNTFHLPTGEMTVTLEHVYRILWISVMGDLVFYDLTEQAGIDALRRNFQDDNICGYNIPW